MENKNKVVSAWVCLTRFFRCSEGKHEFSTRHWRIKKQIWAQRPVANAPSVLHLFVTGVNERKNFFHSVTSSKAIFEGKQMVDVTQSRYWNRSNHQFTSDILVLMNFLRQLKKSAKHTQMKNKIIIINCWKKIWNNARTTKTRGGRTTYVLLLFTWTRDISVRRKPTGQNKEVLWRGQQTKNKRAGRKVILKCR